MKIKKRFNKYLNNSKIDVQEFKDEIDQKNKVNASLAQENLKLTEKLNITNQKTKNIN